MFAEMLKKMPLLVNLGKGSKRKRQWDAVKDETGFPLLRNYVALDCEFERVRNGQSDLGRCSIVDCEGQVLCDLFVMPEDPIYRTGWRGITRNHMRNAIPLESPLTKISNILEGKIVVGHDLRHDFKVLGFRPWPEFIRDTSTFRGMMSPMANRKSLKSLALEHLDLKIQMGDRPHCSIEDARAAMSLYKLVRHEWETNLLAKNYSKKGNTSGNNQSGTRKGFTSSGSCSWPDYVNRTLSEAWANIYKICFHIKGIEADVGRDKQDISGRQVNEHVDRIANDDYWEIKNSRDSKVDCFNLQPGLENIGSKLAVLNKVLNKIKSDSGVDVKTEPRKTKKSKKNFCGL